MMMMMSSPKAPLQKNQNPNGTAVAKTPKACLFNLEQTYEARKKSDHEFMNWWLGTFLVGFVTLSFYWHYRYYRNIARRDSHFAKTHQFYTEVAETIHAMAKDQGNTAVNDSLSVMNQMLNSKETQKLVKPIHWWMVLGVSLFGGFVAGFIAALVGSVASHADPNLSVNNLASLLQIPLIVYNCIIMYKLMREHATLERWECSLLQKTKTMLQDLGVQKASEINYVPQCKPRNFWIHALLTVPTVFINWIYVDYRLINEPVKRFKQSNRVQHQVVQALKQVFNKNQQRANELHVQVPNEQPLPVSANEEPTV